MNILVFDTETTGLTQSNLPATHPSQPLMVQLGAILYHLETGLVRAELNAIVRLPEGATVPPQAANVHGITTEVANTFGLPLVVVLAMFNNIAKCADVFVCHNADFDLVVTKRAYHMVDRPHPFDSTPVFCTMKNLSPIIKLPPTDRMRAKGMNSYKPPSLMEAYGFVTGGGTFDGAHDAMADVRATLEVAKYLMKEQANV
jgi:DNA polymerase-3 subunit epsilon